MASSVRVLAAKAASAEWASAFRRHGPNRSVRGCLIVALLTAIMCGYLVHPRVHMVSWAIGAVLAIGVAWPWLSVAVVTGTLTFSRTRVREGESVNIELTLRNRLPWSVCGLTVRAKGESASADWASIRTLAGLSKQKVSLHFVPNRRGEYPVGGVQITCGFPFGICRAGRDLQVLRRLIVWPRTWPVRELPSALGVMEMEGPCFLNKPGFHGDTLAVRPYRRGDSLRRVHWPQTARHDRLIVCERQASSHPELTVWLDTTPDHHRGSDHNSTLERAIRVAASLCNSWIDAGARVGLIAGHHVIEPDGGSAHKQYLLDSLATIPVQGVPMPQQNVNTEREAIVVTTDCRSERRLSFVGGESHLVVLRAQTGAAESLESPRYDEVDAACVREVLHAC
ncbi:MAG: DUF58 domain-containing protein [Phycisphaerae bacterium]